MPDKAAPFDNDEVFWLREYDRARETNRPRRFPALIRLFTNRASHNV